MSLSSRITLKVDPACQIGSRCLRKVGPDDLLGFSVEAGVGHSLDTVLWDFFSMRVSQLHLLLGT